MSVDVPDYEEFTTLEGEVDDLSVTVGSLTLALEDQQGELDGTDSALAALDNRVSALEISGGPGDYCTLLEPAVLRPEQFGAVAGQDCSQAFINMFQHIDSTLALDAGGGVPVTTYEVRLGEGPYIISQPFMVTVEGRAQGLTVRGIGKRSSEIVWTGSGPMMTNDNRWMGVTWENMSFRSTNSEGVCLLSLSVGGSQDWVFNRVEWRGHWDTAIQLDGPETSNTNSEWVFNECAMKGQYENAWMHSGLSPEYKQQDQFLNFTFRDCKAEPSYGDVLRFSRGGSLTVDGGSWIIIDEKAGKSSAFFRLENHPLRLPSVQHLHVKGVRFEIRKASSQIINSNWDGQVIFDGCNDVSQYWRAWGNDQITHEYTNPGGVLYTGCGFMGKHKYILTQAPTDRQQALYQMCYRYNQKDSTNFVVAEGTYASALKVTHVTDRDGNADLSSAPEPEPSTALLGTIVVEGFDDAAVAAAMGQLTYSGNIPQQEIYFPPGIYNLSDPIFHTADGNTHMLEGLIIRGAGKRRTKVNWSGGATKSVLRAVKALRFFRLEGFSFYSTDINNTFCYAFSDVAGGGYNQRWTVEDVEWSGKWKHVFALDGDADANLNSEMSFVRCETSTTSEFGEAFFEIGAIDGVADNQENQFLNYFFYDCNFTLRTGTVFRINKGGSVRISNGSWSAVSSSSGPITWFHMPRTNYNNRSAANLVVDGVRFEPKAGNQKILVCGWNTGVVHFRDCIDLSSSQNDASKGYNLYQVTGGSPWGRGEMPIIRFDNHQGVGYHSYDGPAVNGGGGFIYEGCYFFRGVGGQHAPATQTEGAESVLRWVSGTPQFSFRNNHNVAAAGGF